MREVLEPRFDNQQALPYGGESGKTRGRNGLYKDEDVLSFMRTRRAGQNIHSDGFLSFGGVVESAYECECGFRGMFSSKKCDRCGTILAGKRHEEPTNV